MAWTVTDRPLIDRFQIGVYTFESFSLLLQIGVDITLQGDRCAGMAEQFTERFDIAARLQAGRGEGVPEKMRVHRSQSGLFQIRMNAFAVAARFHGAHFTAGKKPHGIVCGAAQISQQLCQRFRKRKFAHGTAGLGGLYHQLCMPVSGADPADRPPYGEHVSVKIKIAPFQAADFSNAKSQLHLQEHPGLPRGRGSEQKGFQSCLLCFVQRL